MKEESARFCGLPAISARSMKYVSGSQQARAVAVIPTKEALYLSTDTPFERNHIMRLDRAGNIKSMADLESSSIFGCQTASALFFSTMAEPSEVNTARNVDFGRFC